MMQIICRAGSRSFAFTLFYCILIYPDLSGYILIYPVTSRFIRLHLDLSGFDLYLIWILPESVFHGIVVLVGAYIFVCGTDDLAVIDDLFNTMRTPA